MRSTNITFPLTLHMRWQQRFGEAIIGGVATLIGQWVFWSSIRGLWGWSFLISAIIVGFHSMGLFRLAMSLPGAVRLRLCCDELTINKPWKVTRLQWATVISVEESSRIRGRANGLEWGIRLCKQGGPPIGVFVEDIYLIRRKELLPIMRELQARAAVSA